MPFWVSALECPVGQVVQSVEVSPGTAEVPAYDEVIHHEAVTHVVHHDEVSHVVHHSAEWHYVPGYYDYPHHYVSGHWEVTPAWDETVIDSPAYDETVVDSEAWDETVHHDAVPATDPVFEDQCVADPEYVPPVVTPPAPTAAPEPVKTGNQSGGRHPVWIDDGSAGYWYCPAPLRADHDPMGRCKGKYVEDELAQGGAAVPMTLPQIQQRLNEILKQLLEMIAKV